MSDTCTKHIHADEAFAAYKALGPSRTFTSRLCMSADALQVPSAPRRWLSPRLRK